MLYKSVHEQVMSEAQADVNNKESSCLGMLFRDSCTCPLQNATYISQQGTEFIWEARQMAVAKTVPPIACFFAQEGIRNLGPGSTWQSLLPGLPSDTPKLMAVSSNCE